MMPYTPTRIRLGLSAAAIVALLGIHPANGQHDGHDHGPAPKAAEPADPHAGLDDHEAPQADPHAGHDDHEDGVIQISDAMMKEFGIVVETAGPGTLKQSVRLPGEIVFNADRIAHVTPTVPGIVQRVDKSVGDHVGAGDVMAVLHSQALAEARSRYLADEARLALAKEMLARDEKMFKDRIGTERQVLESTQAAREAEINLNLSEQNLHALGQGHEEIGALGSAEDTTFSEYALRAPIGGIVIARHLTRGEMVGEQTVESPFVVADLSSVWCNLTVYQRDLASIKPGMAVQISTGEGGRETQGTIAFISPSLDEATRTATARVVLDNPDGWWRPGMFITATVDAGASRAAVVLPAAAVQTVKGEPVVFVHTGTGFEPRHVTIGQRSDGSVEFLNGVTPGDRVAVRNAFTLVAELDRAALEHAGHAH